MTTENTPAADGHVPDRRYQRTLLFVVMVSVTAFGSLMTLVTVALGDIAADLRSSRATLTWIVTGLMLAMAVASPICGKLGDLKGHRRIFLLGLLFGSVLTVLCAFAWDALSLIVLRVLFGLTGAMVMPNGMALMMHAYGPERRSSAVGWFQFAMTGAPTIGLVVGGPLIDLFGWRAIFLVFSGVSFTALTLGYFLVRRTPRQRGVSLDYLGAATLALGVLAGLLAITRLMSRVRDGGPAAALSDAQGWALALLCASGIAAFVWVERRAAAPMLKLSYFGRRNFTLPMLASALLQFAYMGGFIVTPALLGSHYGWSVGAIALLMAPRPAAFSIASPIGGYLPTRIGEKKPIAIGALAMIASMAAFAGASFTTSGVGVALILAGLVLSGASAGLSQPSIASLVVHSVDEQDIGIANGMTQQIMFIGIVAGIQTMNVLVGDNATPTEFAATYLLGGAVAVVGLALGLSVRDQRRIAPAHG